MYARRSKLDNVYVIFILTMEAKFKENCASLANQEQPDTEELQIFVVLQYSICLCEENMGIGSSFAPPRSDQIFTIRYVTLKLLASLYT